MEGREEDNACATLIGHGQTMYSACFILSRFINVNIFRPERDQSFRPFFLSYPASTRWEKRGAWLIDRSDRGSFFRRDNPLLSATPPSPILRPSPLPPREYPNLSPARYLANKLSFRNERKRKKERKKEREREREREIKCVERDAEIIPCRIIAELQNRVGTFPDLPAK